MASRSIWVTILLVTAVGVVKAQWHFIQLALIGTMGLTGMWLMHKLAQDYNKIRNPRPPAMPARFFTRRSLQEPDSNQQWTNLLEGDPKFCARRMLCELAATPQHQRTTNEQNILDLFRYDNVNKTSDAWRVFRQAADLGQLSAGKSVCYQKYYQCPYSRSEIKRLIQL